MEMPPIVSELNSGLICKLFPGRSQYQEKGVVCRYRQNLSCSAAFINGLQYHLAMFLTREEVIGNLTLFFVISVVSMV
jgi:hypothetical protein